MPEKPTVTPLVTASDIVTLMVLLYLQLRSHNVLLIATKVDGMTESVTLPLLEIVTQNLHQLLRKQPKTPQTMVLRSVQKTLQSTPLKTPSLKLRL